MHCGGGAAFKFGGDGERVRDCGFDCFAVGFFSVLRMNLADGSYFFCSADPAVHDLDPHPNVHHVDPKE